MSGVRTFENLTRSQGSVKLHSSDLGGFVIAADESPTSQGVEKRQQNEGQPDFEPMQAGDGAGQDAGQGGGRRAAVARGGSASGGKRFDIGHPAETDPRLHRRV